MKLTKSDILKIKSIQAIGFDALKDFRVKGVSTDSRTVKAGDLFIAIRGEQFDGHNFVTKAIESGAAAVVVDKKWADANQAMVISIHVPRLIVENTVHALGQLSKGYRRNFKIPILAVGGSNGKTTTKEMIKSILSQKYRVLCTEGNLNNHIGVPQTLFRLEKRHTVAVLEVGTNHPGEIRYLCEIIEPTHGLITNIGREHLEFFGSIGGAARAEGELFDWIKMRKGTVFVNADDKHILKRAKGIQKTVSFGLRAKSAEVKGMIKQMDGDGCVKMRVRRKRSKAIDIGLRVPGEHNARNALAAAVVGFEMKVPTSNLVRALESFSSPGKRTQVQKIDGVTILNDTYNSNPDSVLAALSTLQSMKTFGKKIAVLADMLELGATAEDQHRRVGETVAKYGVECLLTYGPLSRATHEAATVKTKFHYDQKNLLSEYLLELIASSDVVLVKGSRGMRMEDVVTFLTERYHRAA